MIFIKKIETASDLEAVKQFNPNAEQHIYALVNERSSGISYFRPMVPMDESELEKTLFFFKKSTETVWKGGYYISPAAFALNFDGIVRHQDSTRPLLTNLGVQVLGIEDNQDATELLSWLAGKTELSTEDLDAKLTERKKAFFESVEARLYSASASGSASDQIAQLAKDCMLKFFPWLKVEITFAKTEEYFSEEEKAFKKHCEDNALEQKKMYQEIEEKQAALAYRLSLKEMEENEKDALASANLREQDRLLALEQKDIAMRVTKETADEEIRKAKDKIEAERQEIWMALDQKKKLFDLDLAKQEEESRVTAARNEEELLAARKNVELLELQKTQENLKLEELKAEIEFNKKFREEKLKSESEGRSFNQALFTEMRAAIDQLKTQLNSSMEETRTQMTNVLFDTNTCKLKISKLIDSQRHRMNLNLSRVAVQANNARGIIGSRDICLGVNIIKAPAEIKFRFRSPISGWLTLVCAESNGKTVSVLSPNAIDQQVWVDAGREYFYPSPELSKLNNLMQNGPEGAESVFAIVTPGKLLEAPVNTAIIQIPPEELNSLLGSLNDLPGNSWAAGSLSYYVKE